MKVVVAALLGANLMLSSTTMAANQKLETVVNGPQRSEANKVRDKYRHPAQTLEYFGIKPTDNVVEIWPGGGYWTEVLAPYLREKGSYTAVVGTYGNSAETFKQKFVAKPKIFGEVKVTELAPPDKLKVAPDGSADYVLTFRNIHNWMKQGQAEAVFTAFYKALKKGGILGIEEHRADATKPQDPKASNGYVREDYVIALAEKAGFKLVSKSQINANPKDDKNHPKGVWTLPPTLKLGDKDKAKYLAIGESDRMTLMFKK